MYVCKYVRDPIRLRLRHLYQVEFCSFIVRYPTAGASLYHGHISIFFYFLFFSSCGHLIRWSRIILAILVKEHIKEQQFCEIIFHYENTPIQVYAKTENFQIQKIPIFFIFLLKTQIVGFDCVGV